jgi:hypothetical protein
MEYKGYNIKEKGGFGFRSIHTIGPGTLPQALRGMFTNIKLAMHAIDSYENAKGVKGNGKKSSTT